VRILANARSVNRPKSSSTTSRDSRKKIARDVKDIRKQIEERNDLLKVENNPETVKMSTNIRAQLKAIADDVKQLEEIQKEEKEKLEKRKAKGKTVAPEMEDEIAKRGEIVELSYKHIEECKHLEKVGYRRDTGAATFTGYTNENDAPSELPDIDDPQFVMLRQNDKLLDEKIEIIGAAVVTAKQIALQMGNELEKQEEHTEQLDVEVEKAQKQLDNVNTRLKKQLDGLATWDRFIVYFIMGIILLAIVAFILTVVQGEF